MITQEQILEAKILIIDDQKLHGLFLENILKENGYRNLRLLTDPLKTYRTTEEFGPDLIVLDLQMPQMDGFQILNQLESFRKEYYLPVLCLSSDRGADVRLRALQSGATDILEKPYENIEILFRISNTIEMRLLHAIVENQNKYLEIKVQERTQELIETQLEIIQRLAQAAEFRDNDTGIHIMRMSHYCQELARALGLDAQHCELILNASPLHDVGKIGIPDSILLKPGSLTKEEFEVMKTHTTIGGKLLDGSNSQVMNMARTIALTHHERWDGTGYPRGLKGEEIPLEGQVCSVCDVFDALTSKRPYKEAWSVEDAISELHKQKDIFFKPELVDRFTDIINKIIEIKKKYSD